MGTRGGTRLRWIPLRLQRSSLTGCGQLLRLPCERLVSDTHSLPTLVVRTAGGSIKNRYFAGEGSIKKPVLCWRGEHKKPVLCWRGTYKKTVLCWRGAYKKPVPCWRGAYKKSGLLHLSAGFSPMCLFRLLTRDLEQSHTDCISC